MTYSFDSECFELAQHFFPAASEARLNEIAQCVQDTIEGFSDEEPGPENTVGEVGVAPDVGPGGGAIASCGGGTHAPELSHETGESRS